MKIKMFNFFTKGLFSHFLCAIPLTFLLFVSSSAAQNNNGVSMSLNTDNNTFSNVLQSIEQNTPFTYAYQEVDIKGNNKGISISDDKETVASVLNRISKVTTLSFKQINDNVIAVNQTKELPTIIPSTNSTKAVMQASIEGVVTDKTGQPLPGAIILEKGTSNSTQSDSKGAFSLMVDSDTAILVISYIGYKTKEVSLSAGQSEIKIFLEEDTAMLGEVVIASLGIKRDKKTITYSAQNVDIDELSQARSLNVINSLSGKVAGLNFSTTSNGVGSSSRIVLRGNRSLTGNNQPLYVVDGVPINNSVSTASLDIGGITGSDGISNLNPEDVASISVLKGPSAAALYGSRASNGVILINTKSGEGVKKTKISWSTNFIASSAYNLQDLQNEYGQGNQGVYVSNSRASWGGKLDGSEVAAWQLTHNPKYSGPATYPYIAQPNNAKDFYETGYNLANTFSAVFGKDQVRGYFSYTNTRAEGIVIGNKLERHNVNLRLTTDLSDKLTLDVKTNFIIQNIENAMRTGETSLGSTIYLLPRSLPFSQYKDFEYTDDLGNLQYNYIDKDALAIGGNPYWFALRQSVRDDNRNRFIGFATLKYQFNDAFSLQYRAGLDQIANKIQTHSYASILNQHKGSYSESKGDEREFNTDLLISYNKTFGDYSVGLNAGANHLNQSSSSLGDSGVLSRRNFFSLGNIETHAVGSGLSRKQINSLYGYAQIGYKNLLFLDATARNDWSSALPSKNRSFFYPSVGISGIISDMIELPKPIAYFKVRASLAEVGNDTDPFQLNQTLVFSGSNGGLVSTTPLKRNENLKPEISSSIEFGADIRFFENRLGFDITYFKTNTKDQVFTINTPAASGFSTEVVNGGDVENRGIEITLHAVPIEMDDFTWNLSANFASYDSEIKSIFEDRDELIIGNDGRVLRSKIIKGGEYGDLYIKGFKRTSDGQILVDANGLPEFTTGFDVRAGNFNPDWTAGLRNTVGYKGFSLSFLLDFRIGGEVVSYTQASQAALGISKLTLAGRDGSYLVKGVVATRDADGKIISTTPNTKTVTAEAYWSAVGDGQNPKSAEDFVYDATNIRLREIVLGYTLPGRMLQNTPFSSINISLVGRNLMFLYNKAEFFDPEVGVGVGNLQGVDSFNLPSTRDYGINVKLQF